LVCFFEAIDNSLEEWFINKKTNPLESIPLSVFYFVTF
jgi:hypothetical protein